MEAKKKSNGNGETPDYALTKRHYEISALVEAMEGSSQMLYAARGAITEEHMGVQAAGDIIAGCEAVLDAALARFNGDKIRAMNLYELNAKCPCMPMYGKWVPEPTQVKEARRKALAA